MSETTPNLLGEALLETIRQAVRQEIWAVNQNGHNDRNGAGGELLTAKQAGERWNIPASKIKAMARQGQLPCVRLGHYVDSPQPTLPGLSKVIKNSHPQSNHSVFSQIREKGVDMPSK